jgi:hypothetical protein
VGGAPRILSGARLRVGNSVKSGNNARLASATGAVEIPPSKLAPMNDPCSLSANAGVSDCVAEEIDACSSLALPPCSSPAGWVCGKMGCTACPQ